MDALRTASVPARALLALGEAGRDCDVWIARGAGHVRLTLVHGRAVAVAGVELAPLGDTLLALGELDRAAHGALLTAPERDDGRPIGMRLVAAGAVSAEAVRHALQLQLYRGIDVVLRGPARRLRTVAPHAAVPRVDDVSIDLAAAVWSALIGIAEGLPAPLRARLAGEGALSLGVLGRRRVQGLLRVAHTGELAAALASGIGTRAVFTQLRSSTAQNAIARVLSAQPPPELLALRAILRVLGAASDDAAHADAYALLLRKRRELARNASPTTLLDLPGPTTAAHVRRALRRLARKLHPDRFARVDDRLRAVSTDVMRALSYAASALDAASARSTL